MLTLHEYGQNHSIVFELANYAENGNLYIGLLSVDNDDLENWSDLTVNLSVKCADNCAFIDTNDNGDEIVDWLIANNLGKLTGRTKTSGWCAYPEFEFDIDELTKHVISDMRVQRR
jgi:hypothetical protein